MSMAESSSTPAQTSIVVGDLLKTLKEQWDALEVIQKDFAKQFRALQEETSMEKSIRAASDAYERAFAVDLHLAIERRLRASLSLHDLTFGAPSVFSKYRAITRTARSPYWPKTIASIISFGMETIRIHKKWLVCVRNIVDMDPSTLLFCPYRSNPIVRYVISTVDENASCS